MEHAVGIVVLAAVAALIIRYGLIDKVIVREYESGLLYANGRFRREVGPGAHWLLRRHGRIVCVDRRMRVETVPGQELLTADGAAVKVSAVAMFTVVDPIKAMHGTDSFTEAFYVGVQLALRDVIGNARMEELLAKRGQLGPELVTRMSAAASVLGVSVQSVEIKDIMLPGSLKDAFSEVLRAQKEGQAALERARGETAALRSLANAARMAADSPALLELRTLQTIAAAASTKGNTFVFGMPGPLKTNGLGRSGGSGAPEEKAE